MDDTPSPMTAEQSTAPTVATEPISYAGRTGYRYRLDLPGCKPIYGTWNETRSLADVEAEQVRKALARLGGVDAASLRRLARQWRWDADRLGDRAAATGMYRASADLTAALDVPTQRPAPPGGGPPALRRHRR